VTQKDLDLVVIPDAAHPQRGKLLCAGHTFACVLGRNGVSTLKREGDGATPTGKFALRRVLYRNDRVATPLTALPTAPIARDDGWCDDPEDPMYNSLVKMPYRASAENLWRDDRLYDVIVIIGHNDHPVVASMGSAIFLHVAPANDAPTAGCVALALGDLLAVLRAVNATSVIEIQAR
jgi:L,D-peptidoglycan transpeptidase YkuD (ErfK/YbiS/YcfS/YnhG family)